MPHFYDTCSGPICGLYLPPGVWDVLHRENIQTLDQLRVSADQLEQFDGISARMAQVIRQALAHVAPSEEQTASTKQHESWSA
ncbi:hypothetical protein JKG68_31390 [Microvirga aerilata]|jgi:hypothetical protein|uniref:Helix-hairpin-helix domain-containing protein n=1 Tax=Microvirga aerilata TaxID=670292 RepID=A0A937D416_9HYPH|nr:hypothetical protein [Microvirga aerilata]MBL0408377.1 hypothetical protein [Microvirga aerilata]